jgi:RnfABCDGE-type electron transport complex D subunit
MKITLQRTSPNYRQKLSTTKIMNYLTIGLLVIAIYSLISFQMNKGSQANQYTIKALLIYVVSIVTALLTETVWATIHKNNILKHIKTSFPLVTAIIFALTLPIGTPLYVVAIGSFLAIFLGKLVYGGFGQNIFNPALVGRVIVHLSFSSSLTTTLPLASGIDIGSKATPAAMLAGTSWLGGEAFSYNLLDLFLGNHGGTLGETCIWIILVVGIILALLKVFDARIPVSYLLTVVILAEVFALVNGLNPITYPLTHLCIGGVVFGAIFMATDPVTSPSSPLGKIMYGICLGFLTMIIRLKANYPEGVLFSILIMNMLTPLIDSLILGRTNQNIGKQITAIAVALIVAIGCVFGIGVNTKNEVLAAQEEAKKQEEEEALKAAQQSTATIVSEDNGTYIITSKGFGGENNPLKVEVKIENDEVKSVKVLEYAGETAGFGKDLIEGNSQTEAGKAFYEKYLNSSFSINDVSGIDTSTGATVTTKGIVQAIETAIGE